LGHAEQKRPHNDGGARVNFFITVRGQKPKLFDPNDPPAITTTQGAVEDWIIQNHAPEVHEFHMHQIHFLLLAINGVPVPKEQRQFYDTFQVPYWDQIGKYPSIKVRMDFRGPVVGDFVYHCHILQHEDGGMMAKIRVLPKT
jgi:FtsP/CotA-like multicopper oxidase with cupredoxin domain